MQDSFDVAFMASSMKTENTKALNYYQETLHSYFTKLFLFCFIYHNVNFIKRTGGL